MGGLLLIVTIACFEWFGRSLKKLAPKVSQKNAQTRMEVNNIASKNWAIERQLTFSLTDHVYANAIAGMIRDSKSFSEMWSHSSVFNPYQN